MAKKQATKADILPTPEEPFIEPPKPVNRAIIVTGLVRVRANVNIVEFPLGVRTFIGKGEEGEIELERAQAIGDLVTIL